MASILVLAPFFFWACSDDEAPAPFFVAFEQPSHFPDPLYHLETNPVTTDGFLLGKKLFYDGQLSRDGSISCGSCHIQAAAFAHKDHDLSHGVDDLLGTRNAPPIQNLAWSTSLFWDGGVHDLDLLPLVPIKNPVEMDEDPANVLNKIRNDAEYPPLFEAAFGDEEITSTRFLQALSQFMVTMVSANSKYDRYLLGEEVLSPEEQAGMQLVEQKCTPCHGGFLFSDQSFRNNGLPIFFLNDTGRELITLNEDDRYKFKVPSLRNIAVTQPYMHDGRFWTLEEVLEHYTSNVQDNATLDPIFKISDTERGIPLTTDEQGKIISFLHTLTDQEFLSDPKFSEF
ncbi:MAG: cytochrome-c peroxidase [Flammeovirgaceae bacterium]